MLMSFVKNMQKVEIVLKQQNSDGGKIHKGQEGSIQLVISGGDSAKPLDFPEKTLH